MICTLAPVVLHYYPNICQHPIRDHLELPNLGSEISNIQSKIPQLDTVAFPTGKSKAPSFFPLCTGKSGFMEIIPERDSSIPITDSPPVRSFFLCFPLLRLGNCPFSPSSCTSFRIVHLGYRSSGGVVDSIICPRYHSLTPSPSHLPTLGGLSAVVCLIHSQRQ